MALTCSEVSVLEAAKGMVEKWLCEFERSF